MTVINHPAVAAWALRDVENQIARAQCTAVAARHLILREPEEEQDPTIVRLLEVIMELLEDVSAIADLRDWIAAQGGILPEG